MNLPSTRVRSLAADDLASLEQAIEALPFRVEIKGGPQAHPDGKGGVVLSFVLPDEPTVQWKSVDLRGL